MRNIELRGELTPHTDARGVTRYNEAEILRLAAKRRGPGREGEIAALAFRMFEDGETLSAVVIAVARTPAQVVKLHEDWKKLSATE